VSGRLVLISSYPKSGNTWTRAVLEQLRRGPNWAFSINDMPTGFYGFSRRMLFDIISPVNAADLFVDEIENMFPYVLRQLVQEDSYTHIMKVHDDARRTKAGDWLYAQDAVYSVIYLVRHPFDVAVSCAHHLGMTIPDTVALMGDGEIISHFDHKLPLALPQHVGSWTSNIASWLGQTPYRVTLSRYEDLHANPIPEFGRLARAAGFAASEADLAQAVASTKFDRMRREEETSGFRERPPTSPAFFRAGQPRTWEGKLDQDSRDRLVKDHGPLMELLGYLPDGSVIPMPHRQAAR
jgi:aryl sulfotransferase